MKVLKARLYDLKTKEQQAKLLRRSAASRKDRVRPPDLQLRAGAVRMVKDHRTKEQVGDPDRVLDGDLDPFIKAI
jgi:peptide chain release factor 2